MTIGTTILSLILTACSAEPADKTILEIDPSQVVHRVSPLLYGACIEDVNHEIYGGLYSQMIFGESFQEPPRSTPLKGFTAHGGGWTARDGVLDAGPGDGPKLVADTEILADGEVGVEIRFSAAQEGNAGLIVRVDHPRTGADAFEGYEISLETSGHLVLGRHRGDWTQLSRIPCPVPIDRWIPMVVRMKGARITVSVSGREMLTFDDADHPLARGRVGLRTWRRPASYRNPWVKTGDSARELAFEPLDPDAPPGSVSGMWSAIHRGHARGRLELETHDPFVGRQSQGLAFRDGDGAIGIANQGLNRWGLNVVAGKPYQGLLWARGQAGATLMLRLESADGQRTLAETRVTTRGGDWEKYDFVMTPTTADPTGRFAITLEQPGSIVLGHVFLEPGDWGRYKGLPVRKDVAQGMVDMGVTVLRYGGSMINHPLYRWKEMIGPRDRRPMHAGTWYPYSTNGWGVLDFLDFCEAAGFVAIPALNLGETPQDMADFIGYVNGPADSPWGRKRAADGHPAPYRLKYVELGNEEAVNDDYWKKFQPLAQAIWAKDPSVIPVVGDFAYGKVIQDPYHFDGGAAAKSLVAHREILEFARAKGQEVWFDIHIGTDHPPEPHGLRSERSYIEQLGKIAPGARYKVVIFEYNSGNHAMKRALSNALATNEVERIGDLLPIACAANGLQPDGQNDNGWDQGLLFLDPGKVWLQPPGYLVQMIRKNVQPLLVKSDLKGPADTMSVNAKRSDDGKILVLQVVNWGDAPRPTRIQIKSFVPSQPIAKVEQLAGPLEAVNTAAKPDQIKPRCSEWIHHMAGGTAEYSFPARSITIVRFE